jgi:YVTN family beta-propeller protein
MALPAGSLIARNPANVVLQNIVTGVIVEGIAVSPNNESVYVAGFSTASGLPSHLVVLDARLATIKADVLLAGQAGALDVALSREGSRAYVTNYYSQTVSVISTASNAVVRQFGAGPFPLGLAVSPDGKELWVANSGSPPLFNNGTVSVFDTTIHRPIALINVGGNPTQVVFEKTGELAFVLNQYQAGFVSVINTVSHDIKNNNFGPVLSKVRTT